MENRRTGYYSTRVRAPASGQDTTMAALWAEARKAFPELPERMPEGRVKVRRGPSHLDAIRSERVIALRWERVTQDKQPRHVASEAFYLAPTAFLARVGVTVAVSDLAGKPAPDGVRTDGLWQRLLPALSGVETDPTTARNPTFEELAQCHEANGAVAVLPMVAAPDETAVEMARGEAEHYRSIAEQQADGLRMLSARYRGVLTQLDTLSARISGDSVSAPPRSAFDTLDELPAWAAENEARIAFAPRAFGGAKKSLYEDPATIYAGLEFLAGPYRDNRLGVASRPQMEAALAAIGMKLNICAGVSTIGTQGDSYIVAWRGRRRAFEWHLMKGGGRDERTCLRIYFFFDDEAGMVVVGWLPSHLDNSLT